MSKYSLEFEPGSDERQDEWLVCEPIVSNAKGAIQRVLFHSPSREEAECMLEEYCYAAMAAEYEMFHNQESEFDYV